MKEMSFSFDDWLLHLRSSLLSTSLRPSLLVIAVVIVAGCCCCNHHRLISAPLQLIAACHALSLWCHHPFHRFLFFRLVLLNYHSSPHSCCVVLVVGRPFPIQDPSPPAFLATNNQLCSSLSFSYFFYLWSNLFSFSLFAWVLGNVDMNIDEGRKPTNRNIRNKREKNREPVKGHPLQPVTDCQFRLPEIFP